MDFDSWVKTVQETVGQNDPEGAVKELDANAMYQAFANGVSAQVYANTLLPKQTIAPPPVQAPEPPKVDNGPPPQVIQPVYAVPPQSTASQVMQVLAEPVPGTSYSGNVMTRPFSGWILLPVALIIFGIVGFALYAASTPFGQASTSSQSSSSTTVPVQDYGAYATYETQQATISTEAQAAMTSLSKAALANDGPSLLESADKIEAVANEINGVTNVPAACEKQQDVMKQMAEELQIVASKTRELADTHDSHTADEITEHLKTINSLAQQATDLIKASMP